MAGVANDAGLIVVDVSDPTAPQWRGRYHDPTCSESVTVSGSYAYLAHGDQGLKVLDLSRPTAPSVVQHFNAAGHARGVQVVGHYAYVANDYTGLRILDFSDPSAIREVGSIRTYRAVDVHVSGPRKVSLSLGHPNVRLLLTGNTEGNRRYRWLRITV